MVAGFKQVEEGKLNITSLFLFQVCIGKIEEVKEIEQQSQEVVWFILLDFFCSPAKHIPDSEDFALIFHIACTEVKCCGVENLMILARSTLSPIGERRRVPALFPYYTLKRFGFD